MTSPIKSVGAFGALAGLLLIAAAGQSADDRASEAESPSSPAPLVTVSTAAAEEDAATPGPGCGRAGAGGLCLTGRALPARWQVPLTDGRRTVRRAAGPDGLLRVTAGREDHRIVDVDVVYGTDHARGVDGELAPDGRSWHSAVPLGAAQRYAMRVTTEDGDGRTVRARLAFRTGEPAGGSGRLKARFGPGPGSYGVGQPIVANLSRPVPAKDPAARAAVERGLRVDAQPRVEGAWHWVDATTLHYRPRTYWPAHSRITVRSALDGARIADGVYGAASKPLTLSIGARVEAITDSATHTMTVLRDGEQVREIPVTTGKAGFRTRDGIKVVLGKESSVRMRGESIGIARGSGDNYDLPVRYATRVTWSGEYVHAAPWSVGSQGVANVSHGCVGMSTEDAAWFFDAVRQGDIVEVVNSGGERMTPFDNGYGDWNVSWGSWRKGSALSAAGEQDESARPDAGRLRPMA
ncbi:Ig-like domain-containing protein [Streptomyces sp. YIM 130001]|uniref:L,D-transpeptidase n=1 Tax=Streptomyces sp. YIM 130001 TaxID=2259644 RepID=UPI000E659537|nr:Ig-like domain-containing protein [Streptomyces sp. YIM 130001]